MNSMFFFNIEKSIGLKKLTNADLGISETSRQTHIGLYDGVFQFLDNDVVSTAMLIYDDYCQILDCYFGRIQNQDNTYRSPKIRIGNNCNDSVVSKIREFALIDKDADWYLLWSGLENQDLVFWLINSSSKDFNIIKDLVNSGIKIVTDKNKAYSELKRIMEYKINKSSIEIQKDIEITSLTGIQNEKYKSFDLEKAKSNIALIGKKGEELINNYFEQQKHLQTIKSFKWMNKSRETGLPYDFILNHNQYIDVKSTKFDFAQNIVFSNQEIGFINKQKSDLSYSVYRVFDITEKSANLKICTQCMSYIEKINNDIQTFNNHITLNKTILLGLNIAVSPTDCFESIQKAIRI